MTQAQLLEITKQSRSKQSVAALVAVYCLTAALWLFFNAAWPIIVIVALFCLPLLLEIARNSVSSFIITQEKIIWQRSNAGHMLCEDCVYLQDIKEVRIAARLDGSAKMTIHLHGKRHGRETLKVPPHFLPPITVLEVALRQTGTRIVRKSLSFT